MKNKPFYIFEVALLFWEGKAARTLQIETGKPLSKFAEAIVKAFGFSLDHAFGFYSDFENSGINSENIYELFSEMKEGPIRPHHKGVKKVKIKEAFKVPGDRMLFRFGYIESRFFSVELKEIKEGRYQGMKTAVIGSSGQPPALNEF